MSGTEGLRTLTVGELASATGIQTWRIRQLVNEGTLPHFRVGRVIRFRVQDVDAWLTKLTSAKTERAS